jgi:hypothetical protein
MGYLYFDELDFFAVGGGHQLWMVEMRVHVEVMVGLWEWIL